MYQSIDTAISIIDQRIKVAQDTAEQRITALQKKIIQKMQNIIIQQQIETHHEVDNNDRIGTTSTSTTPTICINNKCANVIEANYAGNKIQQQQQQQQQ